MKRQFGRYVVADDERDELGRGAFGRVYRAFDPNVNRYVAVKVLYSGSDPDLLGRFRDESKTAGKLEHENIVKVYDFDLQDGMPYLVMELLEGETLEQVIKSRTVSGRPMQLLDAVEIMFQVAQGLQFAHSQNVVHRDIKPGNIMVLPNATAKVMDFGIARVMDKDGIRRTRKGDMAGSILYMAPEQFNGSDADKSSDIFAYADVYYELLTGEHPFFAEDVGTAINRITVCDPAPIRERLPECPPQLEAMIQRLMTKDREIRPDKLEEVIFDTQPILQRLRQERAAVLAAAIPALIEAGDSEGAQAAIRQVLVLDPLNAVARKLREQLLEEDRRKAMRTKVQALVRKGEEHLAARRFSEAVRCFGDACAIDRSDTSLRDRLDQAKLSAEKAQGAARLLSEARAELGQERLEAALQKSEQALDLDPGNQEAAPFVRDVRQQIGARRDATALVRAEQHRSRGEYREALAVLEGIEGSPAKAEAAILRGRVEKDRAAAERRRRRELFERGLSAARELLVSRRLDEALVSAEALYAEYPQEPEAADFLSEVREHLAAQRRMEAIGKIMQAARGLINEGRFADACSLIERGLRSYPGDAGLSRLLQAAAALGAARERARQIGLVLEQTHSLVAERRLYDALVGIDRAIAEFGNEAVLVQRKRELELECARAEYAAGLRRTIERARRLLAAERPAEAAALLEEAQFRFPGETDLVDLLAAAHAARAAEEERSFVTQTLSRSDALEKVEQFDAAVSQVEAALARYPASADLRAAAERLRQKLQERERRRMLTSGIGRIEAAIHAGDWARAASECQDALRVFPGDEALTPYSARIEEGQRHVELQLLHLRVQASLRRQDLDDAERQLAAAREVFSQEGVWQNLWRECQSRKQDRDTLALAESARNQRDYALAAETAGPVLADVPDQGAATLHGEVAAERSAAEESARQAEEARRVRERLAIAKGRSEAANLARKGDYPAASALLDQLAAQYPGDYWIEQDREAVRHGLERQRRETEK